MLSDPCKTFRDPVHGDIQLPHGVICELIDHPDFQRLRRIRQLGVCYSTFHGAEHSRFQHTLGACWLAFQVLRNWTWQQQVELSPQEVQATLCAVLLHDVGHGPFSHALEHVFTGVDHESIGWELIRTRFRSVLERHGVEPEMVLSILRGDYPRRLLHELISGQLDVDRMDYLQRDSLFTGTRYGLFDVQRILSSLTAVYDLERGCEVLAVEAKAIEAVEAFLFSRYFMHWQVYFHRAVRAAEFLLRSILQRARALYLRRLQVPESLRFLFEGGSGLTPAFLAGFIASDDSDILQAIKLWQNGSDSVLADLCQRFLGRRLPKVLESANPELQQAVRAIVERRFPEVDPYFGVDRPSDLALEDAKTPIRVLTGRGRHWSNLAEVTRTRALRSLSERVSQDMILFPPECRDEVERLF
ncbi:MAG: HD domain-containing protein [Candidatus Eremiobacteraeota bacterium]|nr:HD domain-containing protein [Candidatus Eremiobacteraeota bacterium]MCW5869918.1 HD domain-containing protein [Candidatus Eremiobacteraeota bacterium]